MPRKSSAITRTDSKQGRFYSIPNDDGTVIKMPSVTTILSAISKPQLVPWAAAQERAAVSAAAADLYADIANGPHLPPRMSRISVVSIKDGVERPMTDEQMAVKYRRLAAKQIDELWKRHTTDSKRAV
jgi:hypothetical protein